MSQKTLQKQHGTILIIEDDRDMNDLLCAMLSEAGYSIYPCFSGEEGLEKVMNLKPDLILLDIMLPNIDGIEVLRKLSSMETTKSIPVIMLTIRRELSTKLSCYIAGAKRFITKPFGVEELLNEVRNTLRQATIPQMNNMVFPEETVNDN